MAFGNRCLLFGGAGPQSSLRGPHGFFSPAGDCMEALCWSRCSLQHVVTLSTDHSGLFCSKNALIYTFWGLWLNDKTFNVCKFWKWGSELNKVVFFGEILSVVLLCWTRGYQIKKWITKCFFWYKHVRIFCIRAMLIELNMHTQEPKVTSNEKNWHAFFCF